MYKLQTDFTLFVWMHKLFCLILYIRQVVELVSLIKQTEPANLKNR